MSTHCVATTKRKRLRSRTRRSKLSKLCFEKLFERTLLAADAVELSLILSELDATPGILVGEQFDVSVYFKDLVNNRAVFSGYADINFSSTLVRVDEIIYDSDYGAARTGTIQSGVVNEVGASDGTTPPADTRVFTLRVTALAAGTASFTSDAGESGLSEIVIFGDDNDQRTNTIFGSLDVPIASATAVDAVEVSMALSELDATPGILVGEQFDVSVYFKDLVNNRAVFSGYADINFSSTLVRVDEIIYDSDYGAARTGTIQSGVVNEVGASDGTTPPADTRVFTLRVTALAAGTASFTSDAGESGLSEIVIFGDDNDQRTNTIFGSLQITIEAAASLGSISGQLFDDINANGIQDNSEGFLPSRTFFIDTNLNAVRDAGEPQSLTDQQGRYVFAQLAAGEYRIVQTVPENWHQTLPLEPHLTITLNAGEQLSGVDFASRVQTWQNLRQSLDVNDDGFVAPVDVLILVNYLNNPSTVDGRLPPAPSRIVPPRFMDVNGDGFVAPLDVLIIVNFLNAQPAEGEVGAELSNSETPYFERDSSTPHLHPTHTNPLTQLLGYSTRAKLSKNQSPYQEILSASDRYAATGREFAESEAIGHRERIGEAADASSLTATHESILEVLIDSLAKDRLQAFWPA